jgi:hypothetical protein
MTIKIDKKKKRKVLKKILSKKKRANKEFKQLLKSGEIQIRKPIFSSSFFTFRGHVYESKQEVIDDLGLGEK